MCIPLIPCVLYSIVWLIQHDADDKNSNPTEFFLSHKKVLRKKCLQKWKRWHNRLRKRRHSRLGKRRHNRLGVKNIIALKFLKPSKVLFTLMKISLLIFFRKRRSSRMVFHTQIVVVITVVRLVLEIRPIVCMNMIHWHCIRRCKVLSTMVKIPAWMKTQALCQTYLFWKVSKPSVRLKCCVWMIRNSLWCFFDVCWVILEMWKWNVSIDTLAFNLLMLVCGIFLKCFAYVRETKKGSKEFYYSCAFQNKRGALIQTFWLDETNKKNVRYYEWNVPSRYNGILYDEIDWNIFVSMPKYAKGCRF